MKRLREFKTYAEFENRRRQHPMKGVVPSLIIFGNLTYSLPVLPKTKKELLRHNRNNSSLYNKISINILQL